MRSLLPGEIKGYAVRKQAKELKPGDIIFMRDQVGTVEKMEIKGSLITVTLISGVQITDGVSTTCNCLQKEDPVIQFAIEEKLEALRKHKAISVSSNKHVLLKDGVPLTTSSEWFDQGRPHQWSIMETEDKYEYWEDSAYEIKVLWAGNKIIAWNDCRKKQLSMYMLKSKEGVCVFDAPTYDLPKYIWR